MAMIDEQKEAMDKKCNVVLEKYMNAKKLVDNEDFLLRLKITDIIHENEMLTLEVKKYKEFFKTLQSLLPEEFNLNTPIY